MVEEKMCGEINFSESHNSGFQTGQNKGTVLDIGTMNVSSSEGVTVYMSGSSIKSPKKQFLDALVAGDTSIGVPIEPPEPESGNKGQLILNLDLFESIDSLAKRLGQVTGHANVSEVYFVVHGQYEQQEDAMTPEYLVNRVSSYSHTGGSNSLSLLFISARLNLTSLAEQFISTAGALTSLINIPGMKLLAAGASSLDMVRSQLVNMPDIRGWRALHIAADSEAEKVVERLLDNGAAVDSDTIGIIRPGSTALHSAASKSSNAAIRIVRALLKKGADPGEPTIFGGNTPLHQGELKREGITLA
ncbi:hypothetical protein J3E69DRAFT_363526 [Trichoderma sp. SZMC 28015]